MMRHAYLIVAHTNWNLLDLLIHTLDNSGTDFYVLIDKKVKEPIGELIDLNLTESKVIELPRIAINWGGYSQIRAEVNLIRAAISEEYDYYHIMQGSDFPIKDKKHIDSFFEKNKGKEFIEFAPENYEFAKWKCCYYHVLVENRFYRRSKILKAISHGCVAIQKMLGIERTTGPLFHGSGLFSVTHACARYILEHEKDIESKFQWCIAADEVFVQSLVMQSAYKEHLYHFEQSDGNVRYIDWKHRDGSSPRSFTLNDFVELMELPEQYCFARKLSDNNIDLAEKIAEVFRSNADD